MEIVGSITTPRGATLTRIRAESRHVAPRTVDVWTPPGSAGPLPVIYMHDGQNLFDPGEAYGGEVWGVDVALERLSATGVTAGAIVVGVWNTPQRLREYGPAGPLGALRGTPAWEQFIAQADGQPHSEAYLAFLAEELKPFVDASFATRPGREATFVMGSSMGGLISLYALVRRPELYGGAGCLSTHWVIGGDALVDGLAALLPAPGRHRLYFDYGTEGLDAGYEPFQRRMDEHLRAAGFREGRDWMSLKFDGADHNEASWRVRLHVPLRFLLVGSNEDLP
jgi:predicted alpha/beta superfamily hydrolase